LRFRLWIIAMLMLMSCVCENTEPSLYEKADDIAGHEITVEALLIDGTPGDFVLTWADGEEMRRMEMRMWEVAALMTSSNAYYRHIGQAIWETTEGKENRN